MAVEYGVETVSFFQEDGYRLSGDVYRAIPAARGSIVYSPGLAGTKSTHATKAIAAAVAAGGYTVLTFDYSGCGQSEGPTHRLDPMRRVRDTRSAISYVLGAYPEHATAIGLLGVSFGAPIAAVAGALDSRVACTATLSGFPRGGQWMRGLRPYWQWVELQERIEADAIECARTGQSEPIHLDVIMPRDPEAASYIKKEEPSLLRPTDLLSARNVAEFEPIEFAARLRGRPSLFIHADRDLIMPIDRGREVAAEAGGEFVTIGDGVGHHDVYHSPHIEKVMGALLGWLGRSLPTAV